MAFFVISLSSAQSSSEWDNLSMLFENEKSLTWSGKWAGFINEVHPVEIVLGEQKSEIKGWMTYQSSKDTLFLEGRKNDNTFYLLEYNRFGEHTGSIVGNVTSNQIEAEYKNKNETLVWPINLTSFEITNPVPKVESPHYNRQYVNNDPSTGLNLTITSRNATTLNGFVFLKNSALFFSCKGFKADENKYSLVFYDFMGKVKGNAILILFGNSAQITFLNKENEKLDVTLQLKDNYGLEWKHYASYETMVDVSYPSTHIPELNSYIADQTNEWFAKLKQGNRNSYSDEFAAESERRNTVLGSAWFEPTLIDEQLFSGYMVQINNRIAPKYEYQVFNYSLLQKQHLDIWNELKSRKKIEDYIKNEKARLEKKGESNYNNEFNKWLALQSFDTLVVSNGGVLALSEYNPKYGLQRILVPRDVVRKELKLFSNLRKIME